MAMKMAGALVVDRVVIVMGMAVISRSFASREGDMPVMLCQQRQGTMGNHVQRWRKHQPHRQTQGDEKTDCAGDAKRQHHGQIAKTFLTQA